jgi:hypothetical protein
MYQQFGFSPAFDRSEISTFKYVKPLTPRGNLEKVAATSAATEGGFDVGTGPQTATPDDRQHDFRRAEAGGDRQVEARQPVGQ